MTITKKQAIKPLALDIDYEKTGNGSGMQIDTLAVAIDGDDYNGLLDYNIEYLDSVENGALDAFEYEPPFLASLTKARARELLKDASAYDAALQDFTEELKERARMRELDDSHELAREVQDAVDRAHDELRHDWLHGDYRGNFHGIIPEAEKRYDIELDYVPKTDKLYATFTPERLQELFEDGFIARRTQAAGRDWLEDAICSDAQHKHAEEMRKRKERRADYETRRRIAKEREAEAEAARIKKLKDIIKK